MSTIKNINIPLVGYLEGNSLCNICTYESLNTKMPVLVDPVNHIIKYLHHQELWNPNFYPEETGQRIERKLKGWNSVVAKGYTVCVSHGNSRWCLSSSWWIVYSHIWIFISGLYQHISNVYCVKLSYHRVCRRPESYACFQEMCVGCCFWSSYIDGEIWRPSNIRKYKYQKAFVSANVQSEICPEVSKWDVFLLLLIIVQNHLTLF